MEACGVGKFPSMYICLDAVCFLGEFYLREEDLLAYESVPFEMDTFLSEDGAKERESQGSECA